MLLFAKDINLKDHFHPFENSEPEFKAYMDYQRSLFPYTIFRGGLDLAYKELDDILNFVDNQFRPPPDSSRTDYPADVDQWFSEQYPWASNFMKKDAVHSTLVVLIRSMESTRDYQHMNTYHRMVLYDVIHNVVKFYNDLLTFSPDRSNDLKLSQKNRINFDDFVNNYWCFLDFMILSKPDYPHERLLEKNRRIEQAVHEKILEGDPAPTALEKTAKTFNLEQSTLACLRRDPVTDRSLELKTIPMDEEPYSYLYQDVPGGKGSSVLDHEYLANYELFKKTKTLSTD